jgi:hypothetical protein
VESNLGEMDLYAAKIAHLLISSHPHLPVHLQLQNIVARRVACVIGQLPWCSEIDLWLAVGKIKNVLGRYLSLCYLKSY